MKIYLVFVLCVLAGCLQIEGRLKKMSNQKTTLFGASLDKSTRITNGRVAKPHSYPWIASLQVEDTFNGETYTYHRCGGVLIAEQWILTAAHCVYGITGIRIYVVLGAHDLTKSEGTEQRIKASQLYFNKDYDNIKILNDLGLIKLQKPAELNRYVKIVTLASKENEPGNCVASGWGSKTIEGDTSHLLRETTVDVIANKKCQEIWFEEKITGGMLCAGSQTKGICAGDSGGPLMCKKNKKWSMYGISSWGADECGLEDIPDAYTRVSRYHDPVMSFINGDNNDFIVQRLNE
ncbi:chymotrypsinogen A-like [Glandiceps talaboti]